METTKNYGLYSLNDFLLDPSILLDLENKLISKNMIGLAEDARWLYNEITEFKERISDSRFLFMRHKLIQNNI